MGEAGAKVVSHGRYIVFQMAEVAIPGQMIQEILRLIAELRAAAAVGTGMRRPIFRKREEGVRMPRKMARQTLEPHAGACCAGSRPYLGSGLLGSPENRYNLPHFRVHPGNPG
jgi:hypothetical protein